MKTMESQNPPDSLQPMSDNLHQLQLFVHPSYELRKAGYILSELPLSDIERKRRCWQCCKVIKTDRLKTPLARRDPPWLPASGLTTAGAIGPQDSPVITRRTFRDDSALENSHGAAGDPDDKEAKASSSTPLKCRFHSGRVVNRLWSCCSKPPFSKPCNGTEEHVPRRYKPGELEKNWRFHETPHRFLPSHSSAVVLDCEMGYASSGESELIRISMVDFFTGAILIDSLVYPSVRMSHYNTRFSGVTKQAMEESRRSQTCILGRDAARQAVYEFVGPDTIVVGHAGHGDLTSLRWIHFRIIDTLLIEARRREMKLAFSSKQKHAADSISDDIGKLDLDEGSAKGDDTNETSQQEGGLSLKSLTLKNLGRAIQIQGRGHDSLEDALATRDLLHWYMVNPLALD